MVLVTGDVTDVAKQSKGRKSKNKGGRIQEPRLKKKGKDLNEALIITHW